MGLSVRPLEALVGALFLLPLCLVHVSSALDLVIGTSDSGEGHRIEHGCVRFLDVFPF